MAIEIKMPSLAPSMTEGKLVRWLKKEGDSIQTSDVIAEIETDKALVDLEAPADGVLGKILAPDESENVKVGTLIGWLVAPGETAPGAAGATATTAPDDSAARVETTPTAVAPSMSALPIEPNARIAASPAARKLARQLGLALARMGGSGPGGRIVRADVEAASKSTSEPPVSATPLARRIAGEARIDLAAIAGSGPHGRVVERDVRSAIVGDTVSSASWDQVASPQPMADATIKKLFEPGSFEEIPHDFMRKTIARRLVEAKSTIPHFYLSVDCELGALLALRERINASAPKDKDGKVAFKVSVNDFVIKALALALRDKPDANVTWTEGAMLKHRHADVGVAVSIPGGLITPIIRKAETKTLSTISSEMKDYAARAKARKLKPDEYQGGSSAVSNLGMFGIRNFAAVINPPHATILAVGAGEKRVVVKNGALTAADMMSVTLSTDHRAVDGALGAELLAAFRKYIESPMGMLV